jgi:biotin carboxyl carrier protein
MDLKRLRVAAGEFLYELDPSEAEEPSVEPALEDSGGPNRQRDLLIVPIEGGARDGFGRQRCEVVVDGWRFEVTLESAARALLRERAESGGGGARSSGTERVRAQIPGRIVSVFVSEGEEVDAGARLLSLEAMKMENEVRAPRAGRIGRVGVAVGQRVELGDELVVIE